MKMNMMTVLMLSTLINFSSSERSRLNLFTLLFWQLVEVRLIKGKMGSFGTYIANWGRS
jgi:hypothetical protein